MHDYFIQISLSIVNGLCFKKNNEKPIANIFIKLEHLD
jgi:hypothetical protein